MEFAFLSNSICKRNKKSIPSKEENTPIVSQILSLLSDFIITYFFEFFNRKNKKEPTSTIFAVVSSFLMNLFTFKRGNR